MPSGTGMVGWVSLRSPTTAHFNLLITQIQRAVRITRARIYKFSLFFAQADRLAGASGKQKRRPAPFEMTVGVGQPDGERITFW
jgi:hypothetical protein